MTEYREALEAAGLEDRVFKEAPFGFLSALQALTLVAASPVALLALWPSIPAWYIPKHFSDKLGDVMLQASICLAASWYVVMILSAAFSAPRDILAGEGLSVVNAIGFSTGGKTAGILIVVTAIMGILTSWNGFIIGATRVLYSMGRAGMLPGIFGTLHPKFRTPYFATAFVGMITIFTPLLGRNSLGWFVDASAFGTVIAYFMVALSFVVLRKREPDTLRPFKVKHGLLVGIIAMLVAVFFIVLYLPVGSSSLSSQEWIIVFSWMLLGVFLYLYSLKGIKKQAEARDRAMYGE